MINDVRVAKSKVFGQTWFLSLIGFYSLFSDIVSEEIHVYLLSFVFSLGFTILLYKYLPMKFYNFVYVVIMLQIFISVFLV